MSKLRTAVLGLGLLTALSLLEQRDRLQGTGVAAEDTRAARRSLTVRSAPKAPVEGADPWMADRVMVRLDQPDAAQAVAEAMGSEVLQRSRDAHLVALAVPRGQSARGFLVRLGEAPGVLRAGPMGRVQGAGKSKSQSSSTAERASVYQWHLGAIDAPAADDADVGGGVVAVLDSGVAYESYADGDHSYVQAPSLAGVDFVSPYDFVNDDAHPNDDHQHGTHIASLIASKGSVEGVAPDVSLMPVKVLDANNSGNELDLIDGIDWAVDEGADVINMSLSFPAGYVPSYELQAALADAADADVVLVAAAGNDAASQVSWPAASPHVISVAAARPGEHDEPTETSWDGADLSPADYSNLGPGVDLSAPGGLLDIDRTGDGVVDGMAAETIDPDDPGDTGIWLYAGTSQAAALVSGAAALLLADGAAPDEVGALLQLSVSAHGFERKVVESGAGAGALDVDSALKDVGDDVAPPVVHGSVLPYLVTKSGKSKSDSGDLQVAALVSVIDADGAPWEGVEAHVTLRDAGQVEWVSCTTDADGACSVEGAAFDPDEDDAPLAFEVRLDGVRDGDLMLRPGTAVYATDGAEVLLQALSDEDALDGGLLAFWFSGEEDHELEDVAECTVVLDMGTGLSSSPLGLVLRPEALTEVSTTKVSVDLDGTGLSSSPLGFISVLRLDFDGTGLSSSPLGFTSLRLMAIDGTGLSSSPLGFHPVQFVMAISGTGLSSSPLGFDAEPLFLGSRSAGKLDLSGTALEGLLAEGAGWTEGGYGAATLLGASGAADPAMLAQGQSAAAQSLSLSEALED